MPMFAPYAALAGLTHPSPHSLHFDLMDRVSDDWYEDYQCRRMDAPDHVQQQTFSLFGFLANWDGT
jgi:hypothetical protein